MDTENFKKVNEKRYKNKQRYKKHVGKEEITNSTLKNKENKVARSYEEHVKKVSEEVLPSNWSKYEINSSEEEYDEKANFETLLDKPASQASYFKFKNEEDWAKNIEFHSQFQNYFTLDLNMLNLGISCVKFSERHGYNDEILKSLDVEPDRAEEKYKAFLNKINNAKKPSQNSKKTAVKKIYVDGTEQRTSEPVQKILSNEDKCLNFDSKINTRVNNTDNDDDIDSLITAGDEEKIKECIVEDPLMATTVQNKKINKASVAEENLEDWLDNILDD